MNKDNNNLRSLSLAELRKIGKNKQAQINVEKVIREGNIFQQSSAQEGQWFTDQMYTDCIYNVPMSYLLEGNIDVDRMEHAISSVIQEQEAMRTVFRIYDNVPSQIIEGYRKFTIEKYDYSEYEEHEQQRMVKEMIQKVAQTHFDLKVYPLWRFALIRLSETKHIFTFTLHHIISDGWSFRVFFNEFLNYYKSGLVSEHDIQYVDYTMWQKKYLETENIRKKREFWKSYLKGATAQISLANDLPSDDFATHKGNSIFMQLSEESAALLRKIVKTEHVTIFHILLSAYYILLYYASGDCDINIGTPYANRNRNEFKNLIGLFMNTFIIRQKINPDQSFREFLADVSKNAMMAEENAEVPIEQVVADLNIDRRAGTSTLFQCLFVLMDMTGISDNMEVDGLSIKPIETDTGTAQFPFSIYSTVQENDINLRIEYNSDLFLADTAKNMVDSYLKIIDEVIYNEDITIKECVSKLMQIKFDVVISSTFVSEMISESAKLWCKKLALPFNIVFAPYSQIFQELYFDDSSMRSNDSGFNVFYIRPEDWGQGKGSDRIAAIKSNVKEFIESVNASEFDIHCIYICPPSKEVLESKELSSCIREQEEILRTNIKKCNTIFVESVLNQYQLNDYRDDTSDLNWHIPYTREAFLVMGTDLVFRIFKETKKGNEEKSNG